jgi:hypothetical protein
MTEKPCWLGRHRQRYNMPVQIGGLNDDRIDTGISGEASRGTGEGLAAQQPKPPAKDWRKAVGMFAGSEFMREVDEEGRRMREAERAAARRGELGE